MNKSENGRPADKLPHSIQMIRESRLMDGRVNPNQSCWAVEGITSPDGRVLGKMGHSERCGINIAKNIDGEKYQPLFASGVAYFKG